MFKYVPVLRYRKAERAALRNLSLSIKTLPLLELMKERAGLARKGDFQSTHLEDFKAYNYPFLVDFPLYFNVTNSTYKTIRMFLGQLKRNPNQRLVMFKQLKTNPYLIPVISYDYKTIYSVGSYIADENKLRTSFNRLGFRIFETNDRDFNNVLNDIQAVIQKNDILIYDIDNAPHTQPILKTRYYAIQSVKNRTGCITVLLRSAINPDIIFNRLVDDTPVLLADNSLLSSYHYYGFDAFSDFAGIRKDLQITDGGPEDPSAGFLFYSWNNNCFIGYRGHLSEWAEFTNHIRPTVMSSNTWKTFPSPHHQNCPGCQLITLGPGNSAANWKQISIMHYIHTMEECL